MWFKKFWPLFLAAALQLGNIWQFLKWALDWRGRYDALAASYNDLGGWNAMIGYILNPPPWLYLPTFLASTALIYWYFDGHTQGRASSKIPIGSLVFDNGTMEIHHKISTKQTAGRMLFELRNATDKLIEFNATLFGDINGTPVNVTKQSFSGYIYPKQRSRMLSDMVGDVKIKETNCPGQATIIGKLRYEIMYKAVDDNKFYRETAQTLTYNCLTRVDNETRRPGEKGQEKITILFSESIEK